MLNKGTQPPSCHLVLSTAQSLGFFPWLIPKVFPLVAIFPCNQCFLKCFFSVSKNTLRACCLLRCGDYRTMNSTQNKWLGNAFLCLANWWMESKNQEEGSLVLQNPAFIASNPAAGTELVLAPYPRPKLYWCKATSSLNNSPLSPSTHGIGLGPLYFGPTLSSDPRGNLGKSWYSGSTRAYNWDIQRAQGLKRVQENIRK